MSYPPDPNHLNNDMSGQDFDMNDHNSYSQPLNFGDIYSGVDSTFSSGQYPGQNHEQFGASESTFGYQISHPMTQSPNFSPSFPHIASSSRRDQSNWLQAISDVFVSVEGDGEGEGDGVDDIEEDEAMGGVDVEDRQARTNKLKTIRPFLDKLWAVNSDLMATAAEKLADGSRDPKWRIPIGDSGVLNAFLVIMSTPGVRTGLMIHVLRLIGNSCADRDENRDRVVAQNYLPSIISLLKDRSILAFVIPVLYNICVDYEPAQLQASESYLSKALAEVLHNPALEDVKAFISYVYKLLDMLVVQPGEIDRAPQTLPTILTETAVEPDLGADLEDYLGLADCATAYMQHAQIQEAILEAGTVNALIRFMFFSYTRFEDISSAADSDHEAGAKLLTRMRSNMNQNLSDISALPSFAKIYPVNSPFTVNLRCWLSGHRIQLQVCACIILGNIARTDAACEEFVLKSQIHKPLVTVLTTANDSQVLHAALGFLKNLALPAKNKIALGDADIIETLPRLWQMDILPQIQYSSISLTRQLAINTFPNVHRLCQHLSNDPSSPAYDRSRLSLLISLFSRTDSEPIKMEIARLITAICRAFTSNNHQLDHDEAEQQRKVFFSRHPDLGRPISFMVTQSKWPVVRSEGWFVMALMARTEEGAVVVGDLMHQVVVFQLLVETLTGRGLIDRERGIFETTPITELSVESRGLQQHATADGSSNDVINPLYTVHSSSTSLSPGGTSLSAPTATHVSTPSTIPTPDSTTTAEAAQAARMQRIDRENALVLVSELLRQRGSEMASVRRSVFEDLLKGGGTVHLNHAQMREREAIFDGAFGGVSRDGAGGGGERGGNGNGGGSGEGEDLGFNRPVGDLAGKSAGFFMQ